MRSRASRPRRKIALVRHAASTSNQIPGIIDARRPLADFETAYGAQLMGATIMGIRGEIAWRNRGNIAADFIPSVAYGFIVSKMELTDLQPLHPNPRFDTGNNDRFAHWLWIEHVHLFQPLPAAIGDSQTDTIVRRPFTVRARRKLVQLEDDLIFVSASNGTAGTNNIDIAWSFTIAVALP